MSLILIARDSRYPIITGRGAILGLLHWSESRLEVTIGVVKLHWLYAALFLLSMLAFFVGTFTANGVLIAAGMLSTVALFLVRRWFLPRSE